MKRKQKKLLQDENVIFKKKKSNGCCYVKDIQGFLFGGLSTRFWMMRKHINSLDFPSKGNKKLPFYCWECITLQLPLRDIELVIPDENHMKIVIQYLILQLRSVDGLRNSASN